jgi:hypothetical protein
MLLPSLLGVTHAVAVLLILWLKRDAPNQSLKKKKSRKCAALEVNREASNRGRNHSEKSRTNLNNETLPPKT